MTTDAKPCRCGFVFQPDSDWGYLDGPWDWYDCGGGRCDHVDNMVHCDSCSANWYRVGMTSSYDFSLEGDPAEYVGGCADRDCPKCVAELEADGDAIMAEQQQNYERDTR